jgi:hypothetical protein
MPHHHDGSNPIPRYAGLALPLKLGGLAIMVRALIMSLIPDPQKSEEEKLATGQMPSQYPPMTNQMAKARREIHHHLTRTTLPMDTSKTTLLPTIRPTCRHQSIRRSKSQRKESSYATMMASEDEAMMLDAETIRPDRNPAEMADPSEGKDLAMTTHAPRWRQG